jgi:GT2 family glycosyltransferase
VNFRVVVCDNASSDGSLENIKKWAEGKLETVPANPQLSHLISPPVRKPISFCELNQNQAESGSAGHGSQLVLIRNGANLGFAGGNNVGLRYALTDEHCVFFWMLNNDTVVEPGALSAMVHLMRQRPEVGLCGSLNLFYSFPNVVQAQGGMTYNRWTGRVPKLPRCTIDDLESHPVRMDYVNGASMLASRAFLEQVGLMEESYFLYFEEMDWALRARGKFALAYTPESVIYHKEGASIGTNLNRRKRSILSEEYLSRNRVLFTKRFFPWALPTVLISICLAVVHRLCLRDTKRAKAMLLAMVRGLTWRDLKIERNPTCR